MGGYLVEMKTFSTRFCLFIHILLFKKALGVFWPFLHLTNKDRCETDKIPAPILLIVWQMEAY